MIGRKIEIESDRKSWIFLGEIYRDDFVPTLNITRDIHVWLMQIEMDTSIK